MTFSSQQFESYVPVYDVVPEKWEDARQFLVEHLKKIVLSLNAKEIGFFLDEELLSGQQLFPGVNSMPETSPEQFRSILRMTINFGALPNTTTKSVPHNVIFDSNFTLTNLYLAATDPTDLLAFSLQYWSKNAAEDIVLNMDSMNVNVTTKSDYSKYTRSIVVLEYIQEL
jgi:hypothetical protein